MRIFIIMTTFIVATFGLFYSFGIGTTLKIFAGMYFLFATGFMLNTAHQSYD